jgi:hypothetical protein
MLSPRQYAGPIHGVKIANGSFGILEKLKYDYIEQYQQIKIALMKKLGAD